MFGKHILQEFTLNEEYTFVNHGSYGAVPRSVHEAKQRMVEDFEGVPDLWFRKQYWGRYMENLEAAARFLNAKPENLAFTNNTTTGINTVLKNLRLSPGDKILINAWTYGTLKSAVDWVTERAGAEVVLVPIRLPLTKEALLQTYRDTIARHGNSIKLAIVDFISSVPAALMPWREIRDLCKAQDILVLVDGAHTPGQVDLNLSDLGVDYFVANLHKWLYTPRGCAVIHVGPGVPRLDPMTISKGYRDDDINKRFYYQGTDDDTTYCVVKDAIDFYNSHGGLAEITTYNRKLVTDAAAMLVSRWGTRMLALSPELEAPNMRMVRLPDLRRFPPVREVEGDVATLYGDISEMTLELMDRFKVIGLCLYVQNEPYVRISANIYNTLEDYEKLAAAVLTLKDEDDK